MTIALTLLLNLAPATILLVLLTKAMRLPYHLPTSPDPDGADARAKGGVADSRQVRQRLRLQPSQ